MTTTAERVTFNNICESTRNRALGLFSLDPSGLTFKASVEGSTATNSVLTKENISRVVWVSAGNNCMLHIYLRNNGDFKRFDGFRPKDFPKIADMFREQYGLSLEKEDLSTYAINAGEFDLMLFSIRCIHNKVHYL